MLVFRLTGLKMYLGSFICKNAKCTFVLGKDFILDFGILLNLHYVGFC